MMMRRIAILPFLALSFLAAFSPARASEAAQPAPFTSAVRSGSERLSDSDKKPRKPPKKPGPRDGTDGD